MQLLAIYKRSIGFALSDFWTRAMAGRDQIRNKRPVFRSYGHVGTMMRIFWKIPTRRLLTVF